MAGSRPTDRNLHDTRHWNVGDVIEYRAVTHGEKICLQIADGASLSYRQADRQANQVAHLLATHGVSATDHVAVFLPNDLPYCQARVMVCDSDYLERLAEIEAQLPDLEIVLVPGLKSHPPFERLRCVDFDEFQAQPTDKPNTRASYRDTACIMYTSGTTGPSKGVLMPHAHIYLFGLGTIEHLQLAEEDIFYIVLPLFHANGFFMQLYATLIAGASAIIKRRFSASEWLNDVRRYQATITNMLGVVSAFVLNQPPTECDRDHRLRAIGVAPNSPELDGAFKARFGVREVYGLYGMTEANIPLYTQTGTTRPGSCGKTWDRYYALRIVDPETDEEVPRDEVGEIVVRPKQPYGFMSGYNRMPEKTVEAWRNFWFHTGDAARMDEAGYVYFVDRIKDCIRRRGENISSYEVESVLAAHPAVADVAAIGVASEVEGAEEEVMVFVVHRPKQRIDPRTLIDFCENRMPRFAVPRYVEFVDSLPKTPTTKVQKHLLKKKGVSETTWDRHSES